MNKQYCKACISLFFILLSFLTLISSVTCDDTKTYIVYLGSLPKQSSSYSPTSHHLTILQQVIDGAVVNASSCLVRSYSKSFNGFAAKLTSDQRDKIADMDEVVSVFESKTLRIQTTRSWDFMGFVEKAIKRNSSAESDVVVGLIDTGIWPESESFSDEGLGGVPEKWRGTCAGGKNFTCNNKIVGARFYPVTSDSARDEEGHGTHTASIAAGNRVHGVSFYGIANGTARGGVPSARIATYAACDKLGNCPDEDILSSFDDAISDGVHIISVSLSSAGPRDLTDDPIAIGSFHAMEKGILTVQAAGNYGPSFGSVSSVAPWILAVAASTTDRKIIDKLVLGNGHTLIGNSINAFSSNGTMFPIAKVNGDSKSCAKDFQRFCYCFDTNLVKGKIVLCRDRPLFTFNSNAKSQGIVGVITASLFRIEDVSEVVSLPSLDISKDSFDIVVSYINSTHDPKAEIKRSEICVDEMAPRTIDFSARGPNFYVAEILKPDISAPGVDILAAYSPVAPVSEFADENRSVKYNFLSGTSMACPHVSGIAAYLKTLHPDWSPAAIKSAILTTARPMKKAYSDDAIGEFEYGSGHVDPIQASDPGLVYDISQKDYVEMLCNFGYDSSMVKQMSGDNSSCPRSSHRDLVKNLNYPLMGANVKPFTPFKVQFKRTVTNVGFANSTYKASIVPAYLRLNVTVNPKVLSFKSLNEKRSFVISITSKRGFKNQTACTSSLTWSDGTHKVRSPIVLMSFHELSSS